MSNLDENIKQARQNTFKEVEENNFHVSSEKTLVFKFAMELAKIYNCRDILIDFEVQLYSDIDTNDKYLDLLIYEKENPSNKIAIEFKAPMNSTNGNSNQTETRKKVYRDIARLQYLKEKPENNIVGGYFLMITNEKPYFNNSEKRDNTFNIANEHIGNLADFKEDYNLNNDINFTFEWKNIKNNQIKDNGKFAWLKPIKI